VLAQPIPGGYTAFSEYEVTFTYAQGVKHVVKTTPDDNIFGGIVNRNGQRNGLKFEGSAGWIWVTRGDLSASQEDIIAAPLPEGGARLEVSNDHMGNFFECVRSRRDPICHAGVGHRSASLCHLAAISLRLGRKLQWDPETELFVGDGASAANAHVAREQRKPYDYGFVS
jgi:hypothetical protein